MRERDLALERHLVDLAARAAGSLRPAADGGMEGHDHGLRAYADHRTMPGPIRERDFRQDAREEIADLVNYASWQIQKHHAGYLVGDAHAASEFARYMEVLKLAVLQWRVLQ